MSAELDAPPAAAPPAPDLAGPDLAALYHADEVAWLDAMTALAEAGRAGELDLDNLAEELRFTAERERREAHSRLKELFLHLLKWHYQPDKRTNSWWVSIQNQRDELDLTFRSSRTLLNLAAAELAEAYAKARRNAARETGLPLGAFPAACPFTLDEALTAELPGDPTAPE